jgi:sigma-B regulation protein RsbU (phosphoserine phosphatase)
LLVARGGGRTESIASSAPPLGLLERSDFVETKVDLEPGDAFFLYTDGLYGSGHDENPRLSSARLSEMLQPMAADAQTLLTRVVEQAALNDGGKPPPDDVAAVAVRRAN